jgi:hypothetical protein
LRFHPSKKVAQNILKILPWFVVHGSTGKNSVNEFAVRGNLLVAVLESRPFPRNEPNPKILTADCPPTS